MFLNLWRLQWSRRDKPLRTLYVPTVQSVCGGVHPGSSYFANEVSFSQVGFLFSAYRVECWYWESVELLRKLALTSILALIAPKSAGQVTVGLILAFITLLLDMQMQPYAQRPMNNTSIIAQASKYL